MKIRPIDSTIFHDQLTAVEIQYCTNDEKFFKIWCLKESYVKAIGKGLHFPLKDINFNIDSTLKSDMANLTNFKIANKQDHEEIDLINATFVKNIIDFSTLTINSNDSSYNHFLYTIIKGIDRYIIGITVNKKDLLNKSN